MNFRTVTLTLLIPIAALLSACGSDGSNADADDSGETDTNVSTVDNDTPEEQITPPDTNENAVFCGAISNEFSYEIFNAGSVVPEFNSTFSVQSPVAGVGWDGTNFCDMDNSAGVSGLAVLIPEADVVPHVDGVTQLLDTDWIEQSTVTSIIDGILSENATRNLLISNASGFSDDSRTGTWWAKHDNEYLYIRFLARNESSTTGENQLFRDSNDPRDDDSIDIFIDGDNSKGSSYDGVDDFHIIVPRFGFRVEPIYGPNSLQNLNYTYEAARVGGDDFYEVEIELASAGIVPGRPFGLEIQLNDDDTGGVLDARFGWFEQSGRSVADSNPSVFATALLTACTGNNFCGTDQVLDPSR